MLGIWFGKMTALVLKIRGRNATSLPGKIALRFSPKILSKLGKQLERCIIVTGTNGKTTTTALLAGILQTKEPIVNNAMGANLTQGLVSALLAKTSWFGRLSVKTALLEVDEATLPLVANDLPIRLAVVTNVFRDQLDRYGELDTTIQKLIAGLRAVNGTLVLNADDPLARHIGLSSHQTVVYFGMTEGMARTDVRDVIRDGNFCLQCGHPLAYSAFIYGQLGFYQCEHCDFARPYPEFTGSYSDGALTLNQHGLPSTSYNLPVRGAFNVYNTLAAITAARVYGHAQDSIAEGLTSFDAPLGRMQVFQTAPPTVLNLIKNPTGCDSVVQAICAENSQKVMLIAINDLAADGKDVSWLWDADFELLVEEGNVFRCVVSGYRAEDMALRLKYAGMNTDNIVILPDLTEAVEEVSEIARLSRLPAYVMTTYTLLHSCAKLLERKVMSDEQTLDYRTSLS